MISISAKMLVSIFMFVFWIEGFTWDWDLYLFGISVWRIAECVRSLLGF